MIAAVEKSAPFVATANPAGGVMTTLLVRFDAVTVKTCAPEGVPKEVVNGVRLVVLTASVGALELATVPRRETLLLAPPPKSARLPRRLLVTGAFVEMRTANTPPVGASVTESVPAVAKELVEMI